MDVKFTSHADEILKAEAEALEVALEAIGQQCESNSKQIVTKAGRRRTSLMVNSIAHQVVIGEKAVYIGEDVEYAVYHELGTGIHAEGGGGRKDPWHYKDEKGDWHTTVGIKPIHFLKYAVTDHEQEYLAIARKYLE